MANIKVPKCFCIGIAAFALLLASCKSVQFASKTEAKQYTLSNQYLVDSSILTFYKPYKDSLDAKMNAVLNTADQAMEKGQPESALGNFFADAVLTQIRGRGIEVDFAVPTSMGGLRAPINKGPVTLSEIFELMPFENEVVILTLSPKQVREVVAAIVKSGGQPCSGITIKVENGISEIKIANIDFDTTKTYKVLTSDYLANGGDNFSGFTNPIARYNTHVKLRDALVDYVTAEAKQQRSINAQKDGRIIIK